MVWRSQVQSFPEAITLIARSIAQPSAATSVGSKGAHGALAIIISRPLV